MLRHVPAVAQGAMEQLHALVPSAIAQQLPARTAEVDALEARVRRLETAAVAKTAPKPRSSAPKASKARPSATR